MEKSYPLMVFLVLKKEIKYIKRVKRLTIIYFSSPVHPFLIG